MIFFHVWSEQLGELWSTYLTFALWP